MIKSLFLSLAVLCLTAMPSMAQFDELRSDSNFQPIGLPDSTHLGANVPGSMIVGHLEPTPPAERGFMAVFYLLLLGGSIAITATGLRWYFQTYRDS